GALGAQAPAAARPGRPLSLEEALRLGERQSEAVRVAEAGALRARGQFLQARSQALPQLNASATYQKQLQNQFQALQEQAPAPDPNAPPAPVAVCTPNIPANATPEQRAAALAQASTCDQSGGLGSITRVFANPNNIILGLTGSQTLFSGGRVTSGIRAADAGRRAAAIGITSARAQVQLDVAQAYFDAALTDRLVAISESSLVQTERAFRQTAIAREVGNVSEFDLLRATVSRDNQRPVLIQARAQRDVAYVRLRQLLDLPLDEPLALTTPLPSATEGPAAPPRAATAADPAPAPTTPGGAPVSVASGTARRFETVAVDPAEVLAEDPAVRGAVDQVVAGADTVAATRAPTRQARENVEAQRNLLRVTRAQRLPAVALQTNYQRFAYPDGDGVTFPTSLNQFFPNWTVSLGVSVPIFNGGRIRGEELAAEANLREAEQQARQVEELSALDARVAVSQLAQAEATWRASAGTASQAARAYQIAEVRFREGLATQVDLADSRLLLQQAEANAATAARDREVARLRLALLKDLPLSPQGATAGGASAQQAGGASSQQQRTSTPQTAPGAAQGAGGAQQTGTSGGIR
ncbi:TolC family protein, partial [Roseisolibacter sp. H3M3-2]|uniref:TolC family protein n=1 Tax=Roseisolibacter sp. H3M3-2 TaxID=3031323 RepID=UPI0023DAAA31